MEETAEIKNSMTETEQDEAARKFATENFDKREDIMLSAAAGSGKTTTMVKRIVAKAEKLPENKHIDSFIIVTFTNAAAAELKMKIAKGLDEKIAAELAEKLNGSVENPEAHGAAAERLYREKLRLGEAYIGTIDSLCLKIVKKNFSELGIGPDFTPQSDVDDITGEVLDRVLEECYGADENTETGRVIRRLADIFADIEDDYSFRKNVLLKILEAAEAVPNPEAWLDCAKENYNAEGSIRSSIWYKIIHEYILGAVENIIKHIELLKAKIDVGGLKVNGEACEKYLDALEKERQQFLHIKEALLNDNDEAPVLFSQIYRLKFERMPSKNSKKWTDEELENHEYIKYEKNLYKEYYNDRVLPLVEKNSENVSAEELFKSGVRAMGRYVGLIIDIVKKTYRETLELCKKRNIFSFSQVEHFALRILTDGNISNDSFESLAPSATALALREKNEEIYIDEYQDTSLLQECILYIISGAQEGRNNRFIVGDVKQSIYGFRNATPRLFLEKYNEYGTRPDKGRLLILSRNFRSREGILDGTNAVFSRIMTGGYAGIDYNNGHRLNYGASDIYDGHPLDRLEKGGICELVLCRKAPKNGKDGELSAEPSVSEKDADYGIAAEKIAEIISSGQEIYDKDTKSYRPVRYSDICVLAKTNAVLDEAKRFLADCGCPCAEAPGGLLASGEARTVISFLKLIDNPDDNRRLMAVMRSELFGFTDGELAELVLEDRRETGGRKENDLWHLIKRKAGTGENTRLRNFIETLEGFRKLQRELSVSGLFWAVTNYGDYYISRNEIGRGNLRILLKEAEKYDSGVYGGLSKFVRDLEQREEDEHSEKTGKNAVWQGYVSPSGGADSVRFMTFHKSKGLEFPFVIMVGCAKSLKKNSKESCFVNIDLGVGFDFDFNESIVRSAAATAIEITKSCEEHRESQRLLYVALTRAREKLFVIGTFGKDELAELTDFETSRIPSELAIRTCKNFCEMIILGAKGNRAWSFGIVNQEDLKKPADIKMPVKKDNPEDGEQSSDDELFGGDSGEAYNEAAAELSEVLEAAAGDSLPRKISVSALKKYREADEEELTESAGVPDIIKELPERFGEGEKKSGKKFTGAQRGTIIHTCLRYLAEDRKNWKKLAPGNVNEYLEEKLEGFVNRNIISPEEKNAAERALLRDFLLSPRAAEISVAERVRCEVPFTYNANIEKYIKKEGQGDKKLAIQGIIDLYYKVDGKLKILDYKTDIKAGADTLDAYKVQLECYRDAVESISGEKAEECCLYFLRTGKEVIIKS